MIFTVVFLLIPTYGWQTEISIDELIGDVHYTKQKNYRSLDHSALLPNKKNMFLQKAVYYALLKVSEQFHKVFPNIPFNILSTTRSFRQQKYIWNQKWETLVKQYGSPGEVREAILKYSSLPGTSRHHWGTDIDILYIEPEDFKTPQGKKIYAWMLKNLPKYGFEQCFTAGRELGYQEEQWHWSYVPLARKYMAAYQTLLKQNPEALVKKVRTVKGFSPKDISTHDLLNLVKTYVFEVSPKCL